VPGIKIRSLREKVKRKVLKHTVTSKVTMLVPGSILKSILLYICLLSVAQASDSNSEMQDGKHFPHKVFFEYNHEPLDLSLTGLTTRTKYFLDIYSIAHYLQNQPSSTVLKVSDENIYKNILQNSSTKQISMVFLRALSAEQIQTSLRSGIKLNITKTEFHKIQSQVEQFMHAIYADVKKNDEFTIRWLPDGTVISLFQGKQISQIKNKVFAKTLWAIWFGKFSVVDRKSLIKELLISS